MTYLCVIPARGGSRGVPRKNLRAVAGKPLIVWTIEQALGAAMELAAPDDVRVVVSSDDEEIASVAAAAGAEVPFRRPPELAGDETATEPVVLHALGALAALTPGGYRPDAVVLLQATSPCRRAGSIAAAIRQFEHERLDSIVGVVPESPFLWRATDPATPSYDVGRRLRRQDFAPTDHLYRETGSIYVTRTHIYEQQANRLGGRMGLFVMDPLEGVDVDTELDLRLAERCLEHLHAEEGPHPR